MKFPSKSWSVPLSSTSTVVAILLALAVPYAEAQTPISPGLWCAESISVNVVEGDQSQGTPKASLTDVNNQLATCRKDDGQSPTFTLTTGNELFTVRTSGENPVLTLKPKSDLDYEKNRSVSVRICAPVVAADPSQTIQECKQLTINVLSRDEAPVLRKTFGPDNTLYLTGTDALPRYNLLNHFADPENANITGELVGQASVASENGYTITAVLTADVLLSFTKRLPPDGTLSSARVHVYRFRVRTSDSTGNTSPTTELTMHLKLGANTPPVFIGGVTSAVWTVDENFAGAFSQRVEARDVDAGDAVTYSLEGQDSSGQLYVGGACLSIDSSTGVVTIGCNAATFDHETNPNTSFKIIARDRFGGSASVVVQVRVNDINEPPQMRNFDRIPPFNMYVGTTRTLNLPYHFFDPEGTPLKFVVVALSSNASITPQGDTRTITAVRVGSSRINIVVTDGTGLSTSHSVNVKVKERGQNTAPYFTNATTQFTYSLSEDASAQTRVGSPHPAGDVDGDTLYYRILGHSDRFSVQQNNGQIYVNRNNAFDYELHRTLSFTLEVSDNFGGRDTVNITVQIQDVNEPPVKVRDIPTQTVAENRSIQVAVASYFSDPDSADRGNLRYDVRVHDPAVASASVANGILTIHGIAAGETSITISAMDRESSSVSGTFTVRVNENIPPRVLNPVPDQVVQPNTPTVIDLANVFADIDSLTIGEPQSSDPAVALATLVGADSDRIVIVGRTAGTTTITLTATNEAGVPITHSFLVTVNSPPQVIATIADQVVNAGVTATVNLATVFSDPDAGDTLSYVPSAEDRAIVHVVLIGTTLRITGLRSGSTIVSVVASDPHGASVTDSFTIRVNSSPTVVAPIAPVTLVNSDSSQVVELANVFADPDPTDILGYTATSSNTAAATATVTGNILLVRAVNPGAGSMLVTATDSHGESVSTSFNFFVNAVPMLSMAFDDVLLPLPTSSATLDLREHFDDADMENLTFSAESDDTSVTTVSVSGSTLRVQGVMAGNATITITATDNHDQTVTGTFMVRVNAIPMVSMAIEDVILVNPDANLDIDLSMHFTDADMDSLTFSAQSNDTNTVSVSVNGTTLTVQGENAGDATITVTATDPSNANVSTTFEVHVNAVPLVTSAIDNVILGDPDASMEIDLSMHFNDADMETLAYDAVSSAPSVVTVTVTGSMLTLDAVVAGDSTITVTATDSHGANVATTFEVRVNAVPMVAIPLADIVVTVGTPLTINVVNTFSDPDPEDTLTISASSANTSLATVAFDAATNQLTITGVAPGDVDATVTATDDYGASVSDTFTITVKTVPMVATTLPDVTLEVGGEPLLIDVSSGFSDADGDVLGYAVVVADTGIATSTLSGSALALVAVDRGATEATVTATDPDGNSVSQTFGISVNQDALFAAANKSLSAFGRAMLGSVSDAVGSRVTSAGTDTGTESTAQALSQLAQSQNMGYGFGSSVTYPDILDIGSPSRTGLVRHSLANPLNPTSFSPRKFAMNLTGTGIGVWGSANVTNYEGAEYDGSASFFHLGADVGVNGDWLIGLAVTRGSASNDFSYGTADRTMDINLTGVTPYARYAPSDLTSIWGAGTIGNGEVEISGGPTTSTNDLSANMFLLGGRHTLQELSFVSLAVRGDAAFATLSTDGEDDLSANLDTSVNRIRAVIEASFNAGSGMEPFVDVGFRNDGGDGDSGTGVEVAGGVLIQSEAVNVEARAYTLASHGADDYSESGVSVVARLNLASSQGTGFAAELAPRWGSQYGNTGLIDNLYDSSRMSSPFGYRTDDSLAISSRLQYGVAVSNDQLLITPFVDYNEQNSNRHQVLIGAELHSLLRDTSKLNVSAAVGHSRVSAGKSGPVFGLNANLRFK